MVGNILFKNTDSTENKNPVLFYCNQMKYEVDKRDTVKILSPNHHDFKFSGASGHDWKLNASPLTASFPLSSVPSSTGIWAWNWTIIPTTLFSKSGFPKELWKVLGHQNGNWYKLGDNFTVMTIWLWILCWWGRLLLKESVTTTFSNENFHQKVYSHNTPLQKRKVSWKVGI